MTFRYPRALFVLVLLCFGHINAQAQAYPQRVLELFPGTDLQNTHPYSSVGFVGAIVGGKSYEGSGAIAMDKRLLFTCAHVLYEKGRWADIVGFTRAANSRHRPTDENTVFVRGLYKFAGYSGLVKSGYDFELDFAVAYTTRTGSFGAQEHVLDLNGGSDSDTDGLWRLGSGRYKTIIGYPSYLDYNFLPGHYYMHQTGYENMGGAFTDRIYRDYESYFKTDRASTGPGNSGGPLLVWDGSRYLLAGVLVSGYSYLKGYYGYGVGAGFFVLDDWARNLARTALDASDGTVPIDGGASASSFAALRKPLNLADGYGRSSSLKIGFSRRPKSTTAVFLSLDIDTARRGDLDVTIRSPRGRLYVLASSGAAVSGSNLKLVEHDISGAFSDADPNGRWQIFVRDSVPNGYSARVNSASLRVTSR